MINHSSQDAIAEDLDRQDIQKQYVEAIQAIEEF
jgi:hypothetical protein